MADLIQHISFEKLGWVFAQFLWISTIYLAGIILVRKVLEQFSAKLTYSLGLGAILSLPLIPALLLVKHQGVLPPLGLADWSPSNGATGREPLVEGLPQFSGVDISAIIPSFYYGIGVIWATVTFLFLGYLLYSWLTLYLSCRKRPPLNDENVIACLRDLAADLNVKTNFKIRKSAGTEGPGVVGLFRSFILIPASLSDFYDEDEIKGLLLHELIHIKRKDYLFSLLQRLIRSLFFFQPLLWWLNAKIDRERELVCDRAVTQITQDSHTYGNTLVKLQLQTQSSLSYSMNMVDHSIVHRIRQLTEVPDQTVNISHKFRRSIIAFLIIVITLFCAFWNSYHLHHSHNSHLQSAEQKQAFITNWYSVDNH